MPAEHRVLTILCMCSQHFMVAGVAAAKEEEVGHELSDMEEGKASKGDGNHWSNVIASALWQHAAAGLLVWDKFCGHADGFEDGWEAEAAREKAEKLKELKKSRSWGGWFWTGMMIVLRWLVWVLSHIFNSKEYNDAMVKHKYKWLAFTFVSIIAIACGVNPIDVLLKVINSWAES
ncbi:hypothetical protein DACRYDRAFT_15630 [Dacryopinax primogenitus]|uniref:Uncharacterized protein n=1 Tax=Dacryopinax primogenitus (strain DJM 731) TaxID=1858805 RepID=M5G8Y1_DACPD|nr:uncharacterized protein DACRYDRAFT_15630 [Dacryopinax primogenitus]EJU02327.1 hypothetical protein DACRYDRAFT_15630 [Dacryopinax primogenitus]